MLKKNSYMIICFVIMVISMIIIAGGFFPVPASASYEVGISGRDVYNFLNNSTGEVKLSDTMEISSAASTEAVKTSENNIQAGSESVSLSYSVQLKSLLNGGLESREIYLKEKLMQKKKLEEEKEEYEEESDTAEILTGGASSEVGLKKGKVGTSETELEKADTKEIMLKQGKKLFILHCDACHPGGGKSYMSDIIKGDEFFRVYDNDEKIKKVIRNGYRSEKADMPSFEESELSDFDMDSIILYLKTLN